MGSSGVTAPETGVHTVHSLARDLAALGVESGETLLVQAATRSLGPVEGGSRSVVRALRHAVGPGGTVVAYAATPENSVTSRLHQQRTAGMDPVQLARYQAGMPAFDRRRTPASPTLGRLAEEIRATPGALRSNHPQTSFSAIGPAARRIVGGHALDCHLGERSPTARLYDEGARALLIGVPIWCCTAYHLADYRAAREPARQRYRCVVRGWTGRRKWRSFEAMYLDDLHFPEMGEHVESHVDHVKGRVGSADCWLIPVAEAVDAATEWLTGRATRAAVR